MKDHKPSDQLDHLLRAALTDEADDTPSARVVAAVMSQVRREAHARRVRETQRTSLLAALCAGGVVLAWAGVQLSLSLWPGLVAFLRVPAFDAALSLLWWVLGKAVAALVFLASYGLGSLLPLLLLGGLAVVPLALLYARRTAS